MTRFDERFARRGFPSLLREYGEWVVYRPLNGVARRMFVVVYREQIAGLPAEKQKSPKLEIAAPNDNWQGVGSGRIDTGGDKVDVAFRKGGPMETRSVTRLISDFGGVTKFEVR